MLSPEYKVYIENCFDAFCKKVIRFEAYSGYKAIKRREQREVSLDYLMGERYFEAASLDDTSAQNIPTHFNINGQTVVIENERLAAALETLPGTMRDLVLLHFFLDVRGEEIAAMYERCRSTISYRKHRSLKLLRREMECLEHEED